MNEVLESLVYTDRQNDYNVRACFSSMRDVVKNYDSLEV